MKFGMKNKTESSGQGKIRKAQLITTFGPGSIAELPDYTVILAATDYWKQKSRIIYEPNLQELLGVKYFKEPYVSEASSSNGNVKGGPDVPAFRFPRMHFCPKCNKLDDYKSFSSNNERRCGKCNCEIVPSRFVVACSNGHLEDFPFNWWVHRGHPYECSDPDNYHKLEMHFNNNTGGLSSIVIKCRECGAERSMEGCMSKDALKGYKCKGNRPWVGFKKETRDPNECKKEMVALQRGASNLYYGLSQSALTIPPWSEELFGIINKEADKLQTAIEQNTNDEYLKLLIGVLFSDAIKTGKYSVDDLFDGINSFFGRTNETSREFTVNKMFEDEYTALCKGRKHFDDEDEESQFIAEITEISPFLSDYLDEVVSVKRLREVLALKGFRRVDPFDPEESEDSDENGNEFTPLWNKSQCWLPAVEMLGEGIFIRLNEEKLKEWEEKNGPRYNEMEERQKNYNVGKGMFSPRYVLLHTLSHLLIRQLISDCGYQEAALKERIYSTFPDSVYDMSGILIYTSSSDSDGSLGGLVRQAEPDLLENTFRNALQEASWCSSDPLCIDSLAQGYSSLNYAACHACALLPETTCESRNCLLDRVSVIGKPGQREYGYFGDILEEK